MTLKRTDLEKMAERKLARDLVGESAKARFGKASSADAPKPAPKGLMGALLKKQGALK
ncbi:hypothetical protein [Chitinimonas sp.]|uniref:hypothetical protein n=1 Tax=Chitinimonas sp. TaxID=1934313 RepID=UPI0035ADBFF2